MRGSERRVRWLAIAIPLLAACSGSGGDGLRTVNLPTDEGGLTSDEAAVALPSLDGGDPEDDDASVPDAEPSWDVLPAPFCGDGKLDEGESCDEGEANSDSRANACRTHCLPARCGDGVVDDQEACDSAGDNSNFEPDACREDCTEPRCGDGVRDEGEGCDTGDARSDQEPGACRLACVLASCGDGVTDPDEGCDDGNQVDNDTCRNNCRLASCGDGAVGPGEECDDGNQIDADGCQSTCRRPRCGDSVVDSGEQCDDGNSADNDGCRSDCTVGCVSAASCSDNLYCNGSERCVNGHCQPGAPPPLSDNIACTADACDEASDMVTHQPDPQLCTVPPMRCTAGQRTSYAASCSAQQDCVTSASTSTCSDAPSTCTAQPNGNITLTVYAPACNAQGSDCGAPAASDMTCARPAPSCDSARVGRVYQATCNASSESCGSTVSEVNDCAALDRGSCAPRNVSHTRVTGQCNAMGRCDSTTATTACPTRAPLCSAGVQTFFDRTCDASTGCGQPAPTGSGPCATDAPSCGYDAQQRLTHYTYLAACADGSICLPGGMPVPTTCQAGPTTCSSPTAEVRRPATCTAAGGCATSLAPRACGDATDTVCSSNVLQYRRAGCTDRTGCTMVVERSTTCRARCGTLPSGAPGICAESCEASPNGATCSACRSCGEGMRCVQPNNAPARCMNNVISLPDGGIVVDPGPF